MATEADENSYTGLAEALSQYTEAVVRFGPDSAEAEACFRRHHQIPEFAELAAEGQRLEREFKSRARIDRQVAAAEGGVVASPRRLASIIYLAAGVLVGTLAPTIWIASLYSAAESGSILRPDPQVRGAADRWSRFEAWLVPGAMIQIADDGRTGLSALPDGTVVFWDTQTLQEVEGRDAEFRHLWDSQSSTDPYFAPRISDRPYNNSRSGSKEWAPVPAPAPAPIERQTGQPRENGERRINDDSKKQ
jgi:hypothetical protein